MPTIGDFTAVNSQTFGDWQRDYLYKLVVVKEPIAASFAAAKGTLDKDQLDAYCDAVPLPNTKQSIGKRMWAGKWYNVSGKLDSSNTISLTFRLDESNKLYRYLYAWNQLAGTDAQAAARQKAEYIGQIAVMLYKTDKETVGTGWLLDNAWICELSDLSLDKTKDGLLTFTVGIAYDKRKPYTAA